MDAVWKPSISMLGVFTDDGSVYHINCINCNFLFPQTHSLQDMRQQAAVAAKVFIQRDYTNGTVCQFQTKFPSELETRVG